MTDSNTQVPTTSIPSSEVIEAMKLDCGCLVTAYLCEVVFDVHGMCLVGRVYADAHCRFDCGRLIRTSRIRAVIKHSADTFLLVHTFSGSRYVVCSWLGEARAQDLNS